MSKLYAKDDFRETLMLKGLNQTILSQKTKITVTTISRLVNQKTAANPKNARKIADAVGLEIKDLFEVKN